jgi:DNA-directed RNA polymerase specialized sigma24 family protein
MTHYPDAPGHRGEETSIQAADLLAPKSGKLRALAREAIVAAGSSGLTADELATRLGMDRWSIQSRTSELRRKGLSCDSGERQAIVWVSA